MTEGSRRLAAIMFTDMVGYTSLAQRDEPLALELLEKHRELVRPLFVRHRGREIKTIGDAFLVEFSSALEATECAVDVQKVLHGYNQDAEEKVMLRIGIHVGDVVGNGQDVYGDAVNIAARIEPLAKGGEICISGQVYDQVRNKVPYRLTRLGPQKLKNVSVHIDVYGVELPWEAVEDVGLRSEPPKNRIAVLPFENMSPDAGDAYFADGMTEELITALAGIKELIVIARTSVMQYKSASKRVSEIARELNVGTLIEGSVRKASNKVRVTVQLIDARDEGHIWAQSYDKQLDDIFAIQSEIAEKVARELHVKLVDTVKQRLEVKPTADPEAYTLYLKGRHHWNERSEAGIKNALACFERAVARDGNFALGYAGMADCYQVMARNGLTEPGPSFQKAKEFAAKALELDENLAEAHTTLAAVRHYYEHDWKGAESEFLRALELKPSYATAHQWYAHLLGQQRRLAEGGVEIGKALALDPFSLAINNNMGDRFYYGGEFDRAIEQFRKVNEMQPSYEWGYVGMILALVQIGRHEDALGQVDKLGAVSRRPSTANLWRAYVLAAMGNAHDARKILEDLEKNYQVENISPYSLATVYFLLGDKELGFQWLQTAYRAHDGSVLQLAIDFEFDGLRDDPRYLAMLEQVGLSHVVSGARG